MLLLLSFPRRRIRVRLSQKEKKEIDKENQIKDDQIIPHFAPKSIIQPAPAAPQLEQQTEHLAKQAKTDAELYPEIPIPHGCPVKHPKHHYGKRWATFSPKVKADRYAWFLDALKNWKGKHAASVYGFGNGGSGTKTMKYVPSEEDQALIDAEIASWDEDEVA